MKIANVSRLDIRTFQDAATEFLKTAPADEVFSIKELAAAIGRPRPSRGIPASLTEQGVLAMVNGRKQWVFGSPAALKVLRKQLQNL